MKDQSCTTSIMIEQSAQQVFDAINNVRSWWSEGIEGNTRNLNDEFKFEVKDVHYTKQKLVEVIPGKRVVWQIIESNIQFVKDSGEWMGTKIIFDIVAAGNKTQLIFTHKGLVPALECYRACSPAWTEYIQHSLFNLITTGKGDPNLEGKRIKAV